MSATLTGEVVFYNGQFGFLRLADETSVFFPAGSLEANSRKSLRLLDHVTCQVGISPPGPHAGKPIATNIKLQGPGDVSHHQRLVGRFRHSDVRHGKVSSPQLKKEVALYYNRLIERDEKLQDGELVVFSPVASSKNSEELFAFFGYPLRHETNASFLREQLEDSQIGEIQSFIDQLEPRPVPVALPLTVEAQFGKELDKLGNVHDAESYQQLVLLLNQYAERGYRPSITVLEAAVAAHYQLMLWENELIADYVPTLFHTYFQRATADRKRAIAQKLTAAQRRKALSHSVDHLLASGKLKKVNNEVKLLLDLVQRNAATRDEELYHRIYKALDLLPGEWQKLWELGYVHKLPPSTSATPLEWLSRTRVRQLMQSPQPMLRDKIRLFYEEALLPPKTGIGVENTYILALKTKLLAEFFPEEFEVLFPKVWPLHSALLQVVLWLFDLPIELNDAQASYAAQRAEIPHYLRLRYYLKQRASGSQQPAEGEVTTEGIAAFATSYLWNDLLYPVRIDKNESSQAYYCFLEELELFNQLWSAHLDIEAVAIAIFEAMPRYQVEHIRLYLQGKVPEDFRDFVGFREPFKKLTRLEKQELKRRFDGLGNQTVALHQQQGVLPCQEFKEAGEVRHYTGYLENLYFTFEKMQLRLEDGSFTTTFSNELLEQKASRGLNSLPVESKYNELPIQVWVKGKEIKTVLGLEYLFDLLQEDEIIFALGRPGNAGTRDSEDPYAEDWALKEQVVTYLGEASTDQHIVLEPTNFYRHLEEGKPIESYEKTVLYTLPTAEGAVIVWENVDFSEDRSTYVFKATLDGLSSQINKLKHVISTHAQLRSALSGKQASEARRVFQRYYGYVGTIRKKRGRNQSFEGWQGRLIAAMQQATPTLPTDLEWEQTRYQQIGNSSLPKIGKRVKMIETDTLDRVNPDTLVRLPSIPNQQKGGEQHEAMLLATLRKFNHIFCAGLINKT